MFGLAAGIAIVLVAAVLGAIVAFGLGRTLGRDAVQRFTGTRVARVDALLRRRGILAVIGLRLVPVVPFTAVNYAAGLTSVGVRDYVLGTAVGIVPGTVAYVARRLRHRAGPVAVRRRRDRAPRPQHRRGRPRAPGTEPVSVGPMTVPECRAPSGP